MFVHFLLNTIIRKIKKTIPIKHIPRVFFFFYFTVVFLNKCGSNCRIYVSCSELFFEIKIFELKTLILRPPRESKGSGLLQQHSEKPIK